MCRWNRGFARKEVRKKEKEKRLETRQINSEVVDQAEFELSGTVSWE